jgi:hypothetical protein
VPLGEIERPNRVEFPSVHRRRASVAEARLRGGLADGENAFTDNGKTEGGDGDGMGRGCVSREVKHVFLS